MTKAGRAARRAARRANEEGSSASEEAGEDTTDSEGSSDEDYQDHIPVVGGSSGRVLWLDKTDTDLKVLDPLWTLQRCGRRPVRVGQFDWQANFVDAEEDWSKPLADDEVRSHYWDACGEVEQLWDALKDDDEIAIGRSMPIVFKPGVAVLPVMFRFGDSELDYAYYAQRLVRVGFPEGYWSEKQEKWWWGLIHMELRGWRSKLGGQGTWRVNSADCTWDLRLPEPGEQGADAQEEHADEQEHALTLLVELFQRLEDAKPAEQLWMLDVSELPARFRDEHFHQPHQMPAERHLHRLSTYSFPGPYVSPGEYDHEEDVFESDEDLWGAEPGMSGLFVY